MARPEKVAVVDEIRTKLDEADAAVLTEYRGLTVHELAELRASLRPTGTQYKVFKNTLARRAIEGRGLDEITDLFEGPVAIAFVSGDAAAAAKALREFGKNHEALVVKGGLLGERVVSAERHRGAGRTAVARGAAHPDRRRVPGTAHPGGRSVPGVPAQPRLRREGAHRPARRRWRGAPVDEAPAEEAPAEEAPAAEAADAEPRRRRPRTHRRRKRPPRTLRPNPSPPNQHPSPSNTRSTREESNQWQP